MKSPFSKTDTAPDFQMSLEKAWGLIELKTTSEERFMFCGSVLSGGSHVQHQQACAIASVCEVAPQTATNWLNGASGCSKEMKLFMATRTRFESETLMLIACDEYFCLGLFK